MANQFIDSQGGVMPLKQGLLMYDPRAPFLRISYDFTTRTSPALRNERILVLSNPITGSELYAIESFVAVLWPNMQLQFRYFQTEVAKSVSTDSSRDTLKLIVAAVDYMLSTLRHDNVSLWDQLGIDDPTTEPSSHTRPRLLEDDNN